MKAFFWKARYALIFLRRAAVPFGHAWDCAEVAWENNDSLNLTPSEAVDKDLAC